MTSAPPTWHTGPIGTHSTRLDEETLPLRTPRWLLALALSPLLLSCTVGEEREPTAPTLERPNLVVFVLDAVRSDHVGAYGYERDTTPNIDRLARKGTLYNQAIADASFTFASAAALFIGAPPDESGVLVRRPIPQDLHLLPEVAREHGYRTYAYTENPYVAEAFGFRQGFDEFDEALSLVSLLVAGGEIPRPDSSAAIERAAAFARRTADAPYLLYVHILRPHNPYAPPAGFKRRFSSSEHDELGSTTSLLAFDYGKKPFSDTDRQQLIDLYDDGLAFGDALFGACLRAVGEEELENTVVVLLSDHGEAFREHGRMLHSTTVFDEMIRVPLVVHVPGLPAGQIERPVQLSDLGRGLHRVVAGLPGAVTGLTTLGRPPTEPTLSWSVAQVGQVAVRTAERKLVADAKTGVARVVFDLVRDPGERAPIRSAEAKAAMVSTIGALPSLPVEPAADAPPIAPRVQKQLEALGYVND